MKNNIGNFPPPEETDNRPRQNGLIIEFAKELVNLAVKIQCTYANCFTEAVWNRGLCIRSFDRKLLVTNNSKDGIIGYLTGNYIVDDGERVWLEATLKYTDRRKTGWFRESDIWHQLKDTVDPPTPPVEPGEDEPEKKSGWLVWLTGGITLLSFLK